MLGAAIDAVRAQQARVEGAVGLRFGSPAPATVTALVGEVVDLLEEPGAHDAMRSLATAVGVLRAQDGAGAGTVAEDAPALRDAILAAALPAGAQDPGALLVLRSALDEILDVAAATLFEAYLSEITRLLRLEADRDPLTALADRSSFDSTLERLLAGRAKPPTLLLLDLDGFKAVNDTLGHLAGDRVLVCVGDALRRSVRSRDVPARIGGDEFGVVLAGASTSTARRIARRVQKSLADDQRIADLGLPVGASIGIASTDLPCPAAELYAAADAALYEAKRAGGGTVCTRDVIPA